MINTNNNPQLRYQYLVNASSGTVQHNKNNGIIGDYVIGFHLKMNIIQFNYNYQLINDNKS